MIVYMVSSYCCSGKWFEFFRNIFMNDFRIGMWRAIKIQSEDAKMRAVVLGMQRNLSPHFIAYPNPKQIFSIFSY